MADINAKLLTFVLQIFLLMVFASAICFAEISTGKKAPDFTLKSVNGSSDIKLSNYTSKPTILVFYASWCPHCRNEIPSIEKIYKELSPKGLNIIGISLDQQISDAKSFADSQNITFPNAYGNTDNGSSVINSYKISGIPMIVVLKEGGIIKSILKGEASESELKSEASSVGIK